MNRRDLIGGACGAVVCFLGFFLSGADLFQRGPIAATCFLCCGIAFNAGVFFARASKPPEKPVIQDVLPPAPTGVNIEAFERLIARIDGMEKRLNGLAFIGGMRARRGPGMPSATDSPK